MNGEEPLVQSYVHATGVKRYKDQIARRAGRPCEYHPRHGPKCCMYRYSGQSVLRDLLLGLLKDGGLPSSSDAEADPLSNDLHETVLSGRGHHLLTGVKTQSQPPVVVLHKLVGHLPAGGGAAATGTRGNR